MPLDPKKIDAKEIRRVNKGVDGKR